MRALRNVILAGALSVTGAFANLATNGSFENTGSTFTTTGDGGDNLPSGSTAIPGWTVNTAALAWISNTNTFGVTTPFGTFFLDLTGYHDNTPYAGVNESVVLAAGAYSMTFDLGTVGTGASASVLVSAGNQTNVVRTFTASAPGVQWGQETLNFTVASPSSVTINIVGNSTSIGGYLGLDNVDIESVSPEPAMGLPILIAAGFFGWVRRKRAIAVQ